MAVLAAALQRRLPQNARRRGDDEITRTCGEQPGRRHTAGVPPLYLVLGTPAAGKSTVCRALMHRFARGLHLPIDDVRHMVVSGLADMDSGGGDPELELQLRLARQTACRTAHVYREAGFSVAIDDFWLEDRPGAYYEGLQDACRIVLRPSLEVTLERLYARNPGEGTFKGVLAEVIPYLHASMDASPADGWQVVDSSLLSVEETVDVILERTGTRP